MTLARRQLFNWILLAIGMVAVLANSLLIWTARRLRHANAEIRFAVVLASVDMALASLIIGTSLVNGGDPDTSFVTFCRFKGPIDFLLLYLSLVLVAVIALTRYYKVREAAIPLPIRASIVACTVLYTGMTGMATVRTEFSPSVSGCDCTPDVTKSLLSAALLFSLGLFMLLSLVVTLFAYLRIPSFVDRDPPTRRRVVRRVAGISLIYLLLVLPTSLLVMVEGPATPTHPASSTSSCRC